MLLQGIFFAVLAAMRILNEYHQVFQEEAEKSGAVLEWKEKLNIIAYETSLSGKTAVNYRKAVEKTGLAVAFEKTFGGSDNNVFAQHGIEGLVIATSMNQVHSCAEYCSLSEIRQISEILVNLCKIWIDENTTQTTICGKIPV